MRIYFRGSDRDNDWRSVESTNRDHGLKLTTVLIGELVLLGVVKPLHNPA